MCVQYDWSDFTTKKKKKFLEEIRLWWEIRESIYIKLKQGQIIVGVVVT